MHIDFVKMNGAGNDFVMIGDYFDQLHLSNEQVQWICDRHFGVGADGVIVVKPSINPDAVAFMDYYNSDGTKAKMCGNGIRCVGKYAYDHHIVDKPQISVETLSGIKYLDMKVENGKVTAVTVDMGEPEQTSELPEKIEVDGTEYEFTGISMGNPHAVLFMDEIDSLELETIGPKFEFHKRFPDRTNTEFVKVIDRTHVKMRVWERGSGETMACGTGACAVAVASILAGHTEDEVEVELLGGCLQIRWDREKNRVFMTGPAVEVFSGEYEE